MMAFITKPSAPPSLPLLRRHHEGFMGQRIGPVAALSFHPIRLVMAAACTDNLVSIYSIQDG